VELISVQGVDGYVNKVMSMKRGRGGKIYISQSEPLTSPFTVKNVLWWILCVATLGIAFIIHIIIDYAKDILSLQGTKANRAIMEKIAEEVEKFVN